MSSSFHPRAFAAAENWFADAGADLLLLHARRGPMARLLQFVARRHGVRVLCFGPSFYTEAPALLPATPENFAELNGVLDRWCDEVGRDRSAVERTVCINPDEVDKADEYLAAGATHLIVMSAHPFDLDPVAALLDAAR